MWLLLFVLMTAVPGVASRTVLETYQTRSICEAERLRILADMAEAYPDEIWQRTYDLACEWRPHETRQCVDRLSGTRCV